MAKKYSQRQLAAGFGGKKATATRRRKSVNGVPVRRKKRRMSGAGNIAAEVSTVGQLAVGALGGALLIGLAEKMAPNYYVRAGGAVVVGIALGRFMPKAKEVGRGIAVAGLAGMGSALLAQSNILPPAIVEALPNRTVNSARRLTSEQMKQLTARLRDAGKSARMAGRQPQTLVGRQPQTLVAVNWDGDDQMS